MMKRINCTLFFSVLLFACACKKQSRNGQAAVPASPELAATTATAALALTTSTLENFESGTKASYTTGDVSLSTGTWALNDALLGNSGSDAKNGAQSARVRASGKLTMKFDHAGGASTVTVLHAKFGGDGSSTWQLWYSTNGGTSFAQTGGTITTGSTALTQTTFTVNVSGNVRFEIRKTDGSAARVNFDDFIVNDFSSGGKAKKFLFDATKAETAGNADWVIDEDNGTPQQLPTPAQLAIAPGTAETYWTGALSSWGIALVKNGQSVETLPSTGSITYGTSNAQDLSKYDVFVVDEPNIRFTAAEKTAILNFVRAGGGLFMISDHTQSDRNNDGWDSPAVWNDLLTNNGTVNNPFGFSIDLTNIVQLSNNVLAGSSANPILHGSQGAVTQLDFHNGATLTLSPAANAAVQGLIWKSGATQNTQNLLCASSTYGSGRVFAVTDSSPMDDGTGAPGNTLFNGWTTYSHIPLFMNASLWLARLQ